MHAKSILLNRSRLNFLFWIISQSFFTRFREILMKIFIWSIKFFFVKLCRCMFVKIVVTPPRNLNFSTFIWKRNIPTVQHYWNSTTKDISNLTILALQACCSKSDYLLISKKIKFSNILLGIFPIPPYFLPFFRIRLPYIF